MQEHGPCTCASRREAIASGEMRRTVWGLWKWPLDFVDRLFSARVPRYSWNFCPFCGGLLSDPAPPPAEPNYEAAPDTWDGEAGG